MSVTDIYKINVGIGRFINVGIYRGIIYGNL